MATYFWGNGNAIGTWNSVSSTNWWTNVGRTTPAATAPSFTDDVIFDTTSGNGNVTITANAVCNNFTVTATQALTIPTSSTLTIYGNLTFPTTGLFRTSQSGGVVFSPTFASTVPGKTISTNGKQLGINTNFNGVGGGWTLGNALVGGGFILSNGTLNTNSFRVSSTIDLGVGTKTLTLGNSTVFFGGQGTVIEFETNKAGFTLNANTSTIVIPSVSSIAGGGFTFNNVEIRTFGSGFNTISGQNTYQNLTFTTPSTIGDVGHVVISNTQTINGTLTINSSGQANTRVCIRSANIGSQVAFSAPTVSLTDVDFRDINFSPPATGTRLGDCGGNNNITFLPAKTVYAVANAAGGFGNFDSNIWATSSGGTPAANNFPLAQDTIIFNNFGSNSNVTLRATYNLGTVDTSARTANTVSLVTTNSSPAGIFFYGNLICGPATRWLGSGLGNLVFAKQSSEQIITSVGITFINPINIDSFSGNFRFNDNFISTNSTANPGLLIVSGSLSANTVNVTVNSITTNYPRSFKSVSLGSGTWTITGTGTLFNTAVANLTWNSQTSNVIISNDSTTAKTLSTTGISLGNVFIGGTSGNSATYTISGNYARLGYTRTITSNLAFSTTLGPTTIGVWSVSGTAGNLVTIRSSSGGTRAQVIVTNKTSGIDYLRISDINVGNAIIGGGNPYLFYAGANSINGSSNSNIAFISSSTESPQTAYLLTPRSIGGVVAGTWTTPSDWNNTNNVIHLVGPGAQGFSGAISTNNRSAGGGGGGGAYVKLTNFTSNSGANISFYVGAGGTSSNAQVTGWSSNTYTANGGLRGTAVAGTSSIGGLGGAASAITGIITASFAGGNGGSGAFGTAASTGYGGGGGGGAGGPNGKGGDGGAGFGSNVTANIAGGGGGGGGGGSNGGNASAGLSGAGGNNYLGTGGGTASITAAVAGANGGGSSGGRGTTSAQLANPGEGRDIIGNTQGSGGGIGGSGGSSTFGSTFFFAYGGGGGGAAISTAGSSNGLTSGYPGAIFIIYSPSATVTTVNSNMFLLF